jgi:hypothetical protein
MTENTVKFHLKNVPEVAGTPMIEALQAARARGLAARRAAPAYPFG